MSDTAPLQLACRFCRPLVEGCPSVFEVTLTSIVAEPVRDIVLEFRCAGLRGGVAEKTLAKPLTAFETLTLDLDIDPERKGTPPMTVHLHASTSRGRFTAHGSVRPGGQAGISILKSPDDMQSLTVQIQEKAFLGAIFNEGGIDIGKVKTLNDFLQLHLPVPMEPVALSWDGFPVARSLKPDGIFAGRFKLIEQIGQGGMGVVWLAEDLKLKSRQVALKFLPETVCHDPDAIDDLKRELLLSQELTHENIVRIHDLIEAEGTVAISMEYIRGKTLSALRREQPSRVFSTAQLLPWLRQLCAALDYAHGKGIIHHDLKPLNLMITEASVLKVCDFGLAGSMAESRSRHSRPGHTSGTTPYMSPQHLLLGSRTVSDDVYALGATLYELLTSKPPYYVGNIEIQIERGQLPPMAERRRLLRIQGAPVPPGWEVAVRKCLSIHSQERAASMSALLLMLEKASAAIDNHVSPSSATREAPFENSLGMRFVPVPIGAGPSEGQRVLFSIWETRSKDYAAFVKDSRHDAGEAWKTYIYNHVPVGRGEGEDAEESSHPVAVVSHDDGAAFCAWLTAKDRAFGLIGAKDEYRLPTDTEWSYAVGIGDKEDASASPKEKHGKLTGIYPWGTSWPPPTGSGNYADEHAKAKGVKTFGLIEGYHDGFATTAPVGSFEPPNMKGLYDMGGNLWEWTSSEYEPGSASRVLRGGSWLDGAKAFLLSSLRYRGLKRDYRGIYVGFRCVLVVGCGG